MKVLFKPIQSWFLLERQSKVVFGVDESNTVVVSNKIYIHILAKTYLCSSLFHNIVIVLE